MTPEERRAALDAIAQEVRDCDRCPLAQGRIRAVPGEGDPDTEVVFVGEGPGQREDQQGRPFVGPAGGLLEELLGSVGWRREDVFITNVVKCRPPGNRDPEPEEMAACEPFLRRQLEVLDPALVVTLGRFSLGTFMPGQRISAAHGTERPVDPSTGARAARAYAMYHPAAALRQSSLKVTMQRDMAGIPAALLRARAARAEAATAAAAAPPSLAAPDLAAPTLAAPAEAATAGTSDPLIPAPEDPMTAPSPVEPDERRSMTGGPATGPVPAVVRDDQLGLF